MCFCGVFSPIAPLIHFSPSISRFLWSLRRPSHQSTSPPYTTLSNRGSPHATPWPPPPLPAHHHSQLTPTHTRTHSTLVSLCTLSPPFCYALANTVQYCTVRVLYSPCPDLASPPPFPSLACSSTISRVRLASFLPSIHPRHPIHTPAVCLRGMCRASILARIRHGQ